MTRIVVAAGFQLENLFFQLIRQIRQSKQGILGEKLKELR